MGMEMHMGKIQIYNGGPREALPGEIQKWWVGSLTILGNQAERTDMHPPRLEATDKEESAAFEEMLETVERQVDRIIHLCEHVLTIQTAQSLTRLIAATKPQYIMRSTLIPISQRKKTTKRRSKSG